MTPNRWLILFVLFVARTTMAFQFQSIASVSPLLVAELHIDLAALGVLVGAWMLPGVFVAIPGGLLGQRFGDKRVVVVALALMAAGSVLVATADGYAAALLGRVVSGTGAALVNVLLTKMVADWFSGPQVATAMGIFVVSWPLGIGLSLLLLGPVSVLSSWRFAIEITAVACAAALVLVAAMYRSGPGAAAGGEAPRAVAWRIGRRELSLIGVAGLVWALFNVAYIIVVSFAPMLLLARGLAPGPAAIVASFATWPLVAAIPLGGVLADRTGRGKAIMLASFALLALVMPLLTFAPAPILVLAIVGVLAGLPAGVIMTLPTRALTAPSRHLGMGIFYALYYFAMALLPAAAGSLRGLLPFAATPLLFASSLLLAAMALVLLFDRLDKSLRPAATPATFVNFAYGSNMSTRRLLERTPSARALGIGRLAGYRLVCRMRGSDGSAKCDVHETGQPEDVVWGVLYEIAMTEKPLLDQAEGLGRAYYYKTVRVQVGERHIEAGAYVAIEVDDALLPYDWYLAFVLAGAQEHGLPGSYASRLKALSTMMDPDAERRERNLAILRDS